MNFEGFEENNDYYYENNLGILNSPNINNLSDSNDFNNPFNYSEQLTETENKNGIESFIYNKSNDYMSQMQHEKKTSYTTNNKNIIRKKYSTLEPPKILDNVKIEADAPLTLFSFDDIKEKIFMNNDYKEKFNFDANYIFINDEKLEEPFLNKKRNRDFDFSDSDLYEMIEKEKLLYSEKENKIKRGRKPKDGESWGGHDRMSPDNIIKKIKSILFGGMVEFINNILKSCNSHEKILKIDYKYVDQIKRENDLKLLNSSIKDILSLDISSKYNCPFDSNKKTVERLLKYYQDNRLLIFALNLKFNEWLDFFTLKKDIEKIDETFFKELGKNMTKIDVTLNKIFNKNKSNNYISSFIFFLYNYESWFINKRFVKKGE